MDKIDAVLQQTHLTLTGVGTYLSCRASKYKFSIKKFLKSVAYDNVLGENIRFIMQYYFTSELPIYNFACKEPFISARCKIKQSKRVSSI